MSLEMAIVSGGALRVNSGTAMSAHLETQAGTFAFTNNTFVFDPAGAAPAQIWAMRFADINAANGVARTIYLVRKENARCLNAITLTRQLP
jgi:hypothetical protein